MALPNQKTFLQFQQEIASEVLGKLQNATAAVADRPSFTEVKTHINDAYQEVCGMMDWSWLYKEGTFQTEVGKTTPYQPLTGGASTNGIAEVLWMTIPAKQIRLMPSENRDWIDSHPGEYTNVGNGTPSFYVETYDSSTNELQFLLGPCPASEVVTVKFGYKAFPTVMVVDGAIPLIPAAWQNLLKLKALMNIYLTLGPGSAERLAATKAEFQHMYDLAWLEDQRKGEISHRQRSAYEPYGSGVNPDSVLFHG